MKRIVLVFAAVIGMGYAMACTNFLVGKDASVDGSTIISYAADSYTLYGFLHFSPAADHAAGEMREVRDWDSNRPQGFIPQVAHTYNVVGNMNEHQLTIGETTWGGREELWDTVGIDYGSLMYVVRRLARRLIAWCRWWNNTATRRKVRLSLSETRTRYGLWI